MFYYDSPEKNNQQQPLTPEDTSRFAPGEMYSPPTPQTPDIEPSPWPESPSQSVPVQPVVQQPVHSASYTQSGHYMNPASYTQTTPYAAPAQPGYSAQQMNWGQSAQPGYHPAMTGHLAPSVQSGSQLQHAGTTQPLARSARNGGSAPKSAALFLLTCVIVAIFGVGLFSGWALANTQTSSSASTSSSSTTSSSQSSGNGSSALLAESQQEAVIAKVEPAIVEIQGQTSQGEAIGSGVIIDSKGDIVTNNHVIDGTRSLTVTLSNGTTVAAQVVGSDAPADLAIVKIQPFSGMVVATLGDSSKVTVGESVLAIGNPLGYSETVTQGVVSALNRSASESSSVTLSGLIQTSAAINPGNSGGALVDLQGNVIGMPTLSAIDTETNTPANGLGFAISSNQIKAAIAQILNN